MGGIISNNYTYKPREYFEAEGCRLILDQYNRPTTIIARDQNTKTFSYNTWIKFYELILPSVVDDQHEIKNYPGYMEDNKYGVRVNLVDGNPIKFTYRDDNPEAHYAVCDRLLYSRDPIDRLGSGVMILFITMPLFLCGVFVAMLMTITNFIS